MWIVDEALAKRVRRNVFSGVDGGAISDEAKGWKRGLRRWGLGRKMVGIEDEVVGDGKWVIVWA